MNCTFVINACSEDYIGQIANLSSFVNSNICTDSKLLIKKAVIFFCDILDKDSIIKRCPAELIVFAHMKRYQPECILSALVKIHNEAPSDLYIFPSTNAGTELSVRLAARLRGESLVSVQRGRFFNQKVIFSKQVYGNHAIADFLLNKTPFCISIANGCTDKQEIENLYLKNHKEIELDSSCDFMAEHSIEKMTIENKLESSKFLFAVGKGIGSKDKTNDIEKLAISVGAAFGVSRPVAMSAWANIDKLIGVSGVITNPDICIAIGVSGAAAFYVGIEKSKFIIAINSDSSSSIAHSADIVIADDYEDIIYELIELISADIKQ